MTDRAPDAPPTADRRTLLTAAAWAAPVLAAPVVTPLAAATQVDSAGDFYVSVEVRSSSAGWRANFYLNPAPGMTIPAGTLLVIEATSVHSRSWTVVSSEFTFVETVIRDANGNPTSDSVNGHYTSSTYMTARAFTEPHYIGLYSVPYRNSVWGLRATATLPAGWTAGPGAILVATHGPLYT